MFRVHGILPGPSGPIDPVATWLLRARLLAKVMFERDDPNMEKIGDVIGSMVDFLTSSVPVMIVPANDPECGATRAAYVGDQRPPIILCPAFFKGTSEQRIRTMIHEAAHLAHIGSAGLGEGYCADFDCETSCGGLDSADSWAHFVHCLSGQTPDEPKPIQGRAPAGSKVHAPQRDSGDRQ